MTYQAKQLLYNPTWGRGDRGDGTIFAISDRLCRSLTLTQPSERGQNPLGGQLRHIHQRLEFDMASKVVLTLNYGDEEASLTLLDPIGPNNTWSCVPSSFLSAASGAWSQGLASKPVILSDQGSKQIVSQFADLNMFDPVINQQGEAVGFGSGGLVEDQQIYTWKIAEIG